MITILIFFFCMMHEKTLTQRKSIRRHLWKRFHLTWLHEDDKGISRKWIDSLSGRDRARCSLAWEFKKTDLISVARDNSGDSVWVRVCHKHMHTVSRGKTVTTDVCLAKRWRIYLEYFKWLEMIRQEYDLEHGRKQSVILVRDSSLVRQVNRCVFKVG